MNNSDIIFFFFSYFTKVPYQVYSHSAAHRQFFSLCKATRVGVDGEEKGGGYTTHFALHITIRNVQRSVVAMGGGGAHVHVSRSLESGAAAQGLPEVGL